MMISDTCPVCTSDYVIHIVNIWAQRTKKQIPLRFCMHCQSFFCSEGYKENDYALQNDAKYNESVMKEKEPALKNFVNDMTGRISHMLNPQEVRYADIGCGVGQLVNLFSFPVKVGYDVNLYAVHRGRELFPSLELHGVSFSNAPGGFYNFVTLIDVLEHIPEPLPFLRTIFSLLAPNGFVYLTVPRLDEDNWHWLKENTMDSKSPFKDCDVHVTHFSTKGLRQLPNQLPIAQSLMNFSGAWPLNGVLIQK